MEMTMNANCIAFPRNQLPQIKESIPIGESSPVARGMVTDVGCQHTGDCVLERFVVDTQRCGLIGEQRNAKILYLAVTTRLFESPVPVVVYGSSGSGKPHLVNRVLEFFPDDAFHYFTSMSSKGLAYLSQDLAHRFLVLAEDDAISGEEQSYFLRTLISEGKIVHQTVDKAGGLKGRTIVVEGPVGAILTSIDGDLDSELGTRLLKLSMDESQEQRKAILLSLDDTREDVPLDTWHAQQELVARFIEAGGRVGIPFHREIVEARDDFDLTARQLRMLYDFIRAHAILNASDATLNDGEVETTLEDYECVRLLLEPIFAEDAREGVSEPVRHIVNAVSTLHSQGVDPVTNRDIMRETGMTSASVSRSVAKAVESGFLTNGDPNPGRPSQLRLGYPLPEQTTILPTADEIRESIAIAAIETGGL